MSQPSTDNSIGQIKQQEDMTPPQQEAVTPPQQVDKRQPVDMFLAMLQGAPAMVRVGPIVDNKPTQTYFLPKHLLACHSSYFRNEFAKPTKDNAVTHIDLPDVDPIQFGFFVYFLYRGNYSGTMDKEAAMSGELIPPSVKAYAMADKFGAKSFQDHIMYHIFHDLGKIFSITPELMEWTETNMAPTSKLRAFFVDAWICYWGRHNSVVKNSNETDEKWCVLFDAFPDMQKEFIFGLKGNVRIKRYEKYCVGVYEQVPPAVVIKDEDP